MQTKIPKREMPTDPIIGKPAAGSIPSVADFGYQVKYQQAFTEAHTFRL